MGDTILKGDMNWQKWIIKWGKGIGVTLAATGLIYTASFMQTNPLPISTEYAFLTGLIITTLNQVGNWLIHA